MKEVPDSMVFTDDVVLCGCNEVDMTEYLESWRNSLEESEWNVRHAVDKKTTGDVRRFEQAERTSLLGVFSRVIVIVPSYIATGSYVIKHSLLQNLYCLIIHDLQYTENVIQFV